LKRRRKTPQALDLLSGIIERLFASEEERREELAAEERERAALEEELLTTAANISAAQARLTELPARHVEAGYWSEWLGVTSSTHPPARRHGAARRAT
jgi:beta-phosphoglucomutase-like phosphatase (HAD superfamily)